MPVKLKTPLKDDDESKGKGRRYNHEIGKAPGGIRIDEVALGMKLAAVAITDEESGTLKKIGEKNPWHVHAMGLITGSLSNAHKPLSTVLASTFGLELDKAFSYTKITGGGHPVDTQGYIAHGEHDVVLSYRCTIGGFDWLTNLSTTTSEFEPDIDGAQGHSGFLSCLEGRCTGSKPRVHTGFYNGFLVTLKDIEELLEPQIKGTKTRKRFFVVGHSLGAGVATVAFAYLLLKYNWENFPHKLILVTAGGPRVCDEALASKINKEIKRLRPMDKCCSVRIVRDEDVVPSVPMNLLGFYHIRSLVQLDRVGDLLINPETASGGRDDGDDEERGDAFPDLGTFMEDVKDQVKDAATRTSDAVQEAAENFSFDADGYRSLLAKIPGPFVDHMPDMYLDPLMSLLAKNSPLQLGIIKAAGLVNLDFVGVSDPYCVCKVIGKGEQKEEWSCRTQRIDGSLEPEWNFLTAIPVYEEGDEGLEFTIWDSNTLRKDKLMGRARLDAKLFHKYGFRGDLPLEETGSDKPATLTVRVSRSDDSAASPTPGS